MGKVGECLMRKDRLLRIYKMMKSKPLKTWIMKDFFVTRSFKERTYLNTLISLGLIEQVKCITRVKIYPYGRRPKKVEADYKTKGYRIKRVTEYLPQSSHSSDLTQVSDRPVFQKEGELPNINSQLIHRSPSRSKTHRDTLQENGGNPSSFKERTK